MHIVWSSMLIPKEDHNELLTEFIKKMEEKNVKAQKQRIKTCPPHTCYYPDFKSKMVEEGVPEVTIEMEHEIMSLEGVKTRLQSFAETLGVM